MRRYFGLGFLCVMVGACDAGGSGLKDKNKGDDSGGDSGPVVVDDDADGFAVEDDCDDANADVNPGATELCDEIDNDCDEEVDESDAEDAEVYYVDEDGDGFGDPDAPLSACTQPEGAVSDNTDCDDSSAIAYPGAWDRCNAVDDDCDGEVDEAALDGLSLYTIDDASGTIYTLDPATGDLTDGATLSGSAHKINSLATDVSTLVTYSQDVSVSKLVELDLCSGTVSNAGPTGDIGLCGLAFGKDGVLYGVDSTNDLLVTIDPTNGTVTTVGSIGADVGNCGLAYDCKDDKLVMLAPKLNSFYELNTSTGAGAVVATYEDLSIFSVGLEYNPATGEFLSVASSSLYSYDLDASTFEVVASTSGKNLDNLAWGASCE